MTHSKFNTLKTAKIVLIFENAVGVDVNAVATKNIQTGYGIKLQRVRQPRDAGMLVGQQKNLHPPRRAHLMLDG